MLMEATANIGYYLQNWDSDLFSIACLLAIFLLISGYFYGKAFQKLIPAIEKIDATFFGVYFIFAVFEIFDIYAIIHSSSTIAGMRLIEILILGGPILCLICRANILPQGENFRSLLVGLGIAILFGIVAAQWNTNNSFFDSIDYLSQVIEQANADNFYYFNTYSGALKDNIRVEDDFQGFYQFWGCYLKLASEFLNPERVELTPIYIWGASVLYWFNLGNLVCCSVRVVYEDNRKWYTLLLCMLMISPFYTNYYNTVLAFFGNSFRNLIVGYGMVIVYLYLHTHDYRLYFLSAVVTYAGISASATNLVTMTAIAAALLFVETLNPKATWRHYAAWSLSLLPIIRFALIVLIQDAVMDWLFTECLAILSVIMLAGISYLVGNHLKAFGYFVRIVMALAFVYMIYQSYPLGNTYYGYSYFFIQVSDYSMIQNFTTHQDTVELIRNIIMYLFVILIFFNFKDNKSLKILLVFIAVMFINPLTEPYLATNILKLEYHRLFDILVNPLTLIFLIHNAEKLLQHIPRTVPLIISLSISAAALVFIDYPNMTVAKVTWMAYNEEDYNWVYKVSDSTMDMYDYIYENIYRSKTSRPVILSQDASLRAYVSEVITPVTTIEIRDSFTKEDTFNKIELFMQLLYPNKYRVSSDIKHPFGDINDADYTRLWELITMYNPDYLIMRSTLVLWNDTGGYYEHAYAQIVSEGQATVLYENDEWTLLEINY